MIFCAVSRDVIIPPVVPVVNPVITVTHRQRAVNGSFDTRPFTNNLCHFLTYS